MTSPGRRLVDAVVARDRDAFRSVLAPDVDFKGLTPRRLWEAQDPGGVEAAFLDAWFEEQDRITDLAQVEEDEVADTRRIGYRFEMETPDGSHVAEQQAYYRATDDRISYLRVVCSGFRPR